jgi:hypothetical protein
MPLTREDLYAKHELLNEAELHGTDNLEQVAADFDAARRLRDEVGPENWAKACEFDRQLLEAGDRRPSAERFADIAVTMVNGDEWSDAEIASALRGTMPGYTDAHGVYAVRLLRPGLSQAKAERILNELQMGDSKKAFAELASFESSQDLHDMERAEAVSHMARARGGRQ